MRNNYTGKDLRLVRKLRIDNQLETWNFIIVEHFNGNRAVRICKTSWMKVLVSEYIFDL